MKFYSFFYTSLQLKDKLLCYLSTVKILRPFIKHWAEYTFIILKAMFLLNS
jgi:hypothetical protein